MQRSMLLGAACLAAALWAGCTPTYTFRNPALPPADLSKERLLLLPVDVRGLPFAEKKLPASLVAGARDAFDRRVVDLGPGAPSFAAAGLDDLGWETGTGMLYLTDERDLFDFTKDDKPAGRGLAALPGRLAKLVDVAARKFDLKFEPRYLLCLNVQGRGKGALEGTVRFRILAGLYDLKAKQIHTFCFLHDIMADDAKALKTALRESAAEVLRLVAETAAEEGDG